MESRALALQPQCSPHESLTTPGKVEKARRLNTSDEEAAVPKRLWDTQERLAEFLDMIIFVCVVVQKHQQDAFLAPPVVLVDCAQDAEPELDTSPLGQTGAAPDTKEGIEAELLKLRQENRSLRFEVNAVNQQLQALSVQDTVPVSPKDADQEAEASEAAVSDEAIRKRLARMFKPRANGILSVIEMFGSLLHFQASYLLPLATIKT